MTALGKPLIVLGLVIAAIGLLVAAGDRLPLKIGRLPGDFVWKSGNTTIYIPLTTIVLLNVVLAAVMWVLNKSRGA